MKKTVNSLTQETLENDAHRWLNIIRYHESGTIIQIQNDAVYRVHQLLGDKKLLKKILGKYYRKYLLGYISLSEDNLIDAINKKIQKWSQGKDLEDSLKKIESKGLDVGLFVDYATNIITNKSEQKQLFELETILRKFKNFSVIIFSEVDITEAGFNQLVNQCSSLFTHIIKYPLYSEKDSLQFTSYNESLWKFKFPEKTKQAVVKSCGGYLWLIRQALRLLRDEKDLTLEQVFSHELMLRKLDVVWSKLTEPEKDVLRKINNKYLDEDSKNSQTYSYLKTIKMIVNDSLGIPILKYVIEKEKRTNQLIVKDGDVFLDKENVSYQLTKSETRIIKVLIDNKTKLVTRNQIAQKIWGVNWEDHYSDWAIDRLIHRLRLKLKKIGFDESLIKTYKSRGIMLG
ncbi:helix-turn-helix domain-containing protein [Patescibacteria group bacterium]|nr:helix-turn-helix domain-containing protein [Patescibacteria group bacterium]